MKSLCLMLSRFFISAWVGAAALFVTNLVREATSVIECIDNSVVQNALVQVTFPPYYLFGFCLVGAALICGILAWKQTGISRVRLGISILLMLAALLLMTYDYFLVYLPLKEMVTPITKAKPSEFGEYHELSQIINCIDVTLCFVAAIILCFPARVKKRPA